MSPGYPAEMSRLGALWLILRSSALLAVWGIGIIGIAMTCAVFVVIVLEWSGVALNQALNHRSLSSGSVDW